MKYKIIHNEKGFSHILVLCVVLSCLIIGFAGYRVSTTPSKSKAVPAQETSRKVAEAKNQPNHEEATSPTTSTPTETPNPAPKSVATTTQKPTPTFTTSIKILGDATCQSTTLEALKLLSTNAPAHYSTITSNISVIECAAQGSGMFAYENPPRYLVGDATRNAGTVWYAGTIAHDAGHSKLYHDYANGHVGQSVPNDVWTGEEAERTCLEAQYDALTKIGGTQAQLDYVKNIINSQYYNIPYDKRWW